MEERTEWEVLVKCEHSYNRRCAKTLKTRYEAAQVGNYTTVVQNHNKKMKINMLHCERKVREKETMSSRFCLF